MSSSGFEDTPGPYTDGNDVDVISVGRPPRFRVPRVLRFGLMAVCGVAVLSWATLTLTPDEAKSPERPTFTVDVVSFHPARGTLVADLISSVDRPVYIDDVGLFHGDSSSGSSKEFAQWEWARATVVPSSVAASLPRTDLGAWPDMSKMTVAAVGGTSGSAVLAVLVRPPCGDQEPPESAHVEISYHTDIDEFTQTLPGLLNSGTPTALQRMKQAVCQHEHQRPPGKDLLVLGGGVNRHWLNVDGVRLSYRAPSNGWEQFGDVSVNKSVVAPQIAEGIVYWTRYPNGASTSWCARLPLPARASTTSDIAAALSRAPGTALVAGPSKVTVGGRAATHLVLRVVDNRGCDPGYFYAWNDITTGPFWPATLIGDTIQVWLVDVGDSRLFVAGETHQFAGDGTLGGADAGPQLTREVEQIAKSIRFR